METVLPILNSCILFDTPADECSEYMTDDERCIIITAQNYISNFRAWGNNEDKVYRSLVNFWKNLVIANTDVASTEDLAINVVAAFHQYLNTEFKQQFNGKDVYIHNQTGLESIGLLTSVFNPTHLDIAEPYLGCYYCDPCSVRFDLRDWMPEHLKPKKIYTCIDSGYMLFGYDVFKEGEHYHG